MPTKEMKTKQLRFAGESTEYSDRLISSTSTIMNVKRDLHVVMMAGNNAHGLCHTISRVQSTEYPGSLAAGEVWLELFWESTSKLTPQEVAQIHRLLEPSTFPRTYHRRPGSQYIVLGEGQHDHRPLKERTMPTIRTTLGCISGSRAAHERIHVVNNARGEATRILFLMQLELRSST